MQKGGDILKQTLGQTLEEIWTQKFILSGELIADPNVIYLRFADWLHVTISDEHTCIRRAEQPESIEDFEHDGYVFSYPLGPLCADHPAQAAVGGKLLSVTELIWNGEHPVSVGVAFYMTEDATLVVYEDEEETVHLLASLDEMPSEVSEVSIA